MKPRLFALTSIASVSVDPANPVFDSREGCNAIIETSTNTLAIGCKNTTIPSSVTSIKGMAFQNCTDLASLVIPDSVTSIGDTAFANCRSLTSIEFPASVTFIGGYAFSNCRKLASVSFDGSKAQWGSVEKVPGTYRERW